MELSQGEDGGKKMVENISTHRMFPKQTARLPAAAAKDYGLTQTSLKHRVSPSLNSSQGTPGTEGCLTQEEVATEAPQGTS